MTTESRSKSQPKPKLASINTQPTDPHANERLLQEEVQTLLGERTIVARRMIEIDRRLSEIGRSLTDLRGERGGIPKPELMGKMLRFIP